MLVKKKERKKMTRSEKYDKRNERVRRALACEDEHRIGIH